MVPDADDPKGRRHLTKTAIACHSDFFARSVDQADRAGLGSDGRQRLIEDDLSDLPNVVGGLATVDDDARFEFMLNLVR